MRLLDLRVVGCRGVIDGISWRLYSSIGLGLAGLEEPLMMVKVFLYRDGFQVPRER